MEAIRKGLVEINITDNGYFAIRSEDGLGLSEQSESSTVEKFIDNLLNCGVTDSGYLSFETESGLELVFQ